VVRPKFKDESWDSIVARVTKRRFWIPEDGWAIMEELFTCLGDDCAGLRDQSAAMLAFPPSLCI
jgi:hypothetical protein